VAEGTELCWADDEAVGLVETRLSLREGNFHEGIAE
jgi:hypothetical protein